MKEHDFTVILTSDPSEEEADRLYGTFNDGTISTIAGVPQIHFHRDALSLEEAIRSAIAHIKTAGIDVTRVEIEPEPWRSRHEPQTPRMRRRSTGLQHGDFDPWARLRL